MPSDVPSTVNSPASQVAIITGAAQGIGRAIALQLAADGLDVVVSDLALKADQLEVLSAEIKTLNPARNVLVVVADVSVEKDVEELVARTTRELGGLDVMVANAGICVVNSILDTSVEEWERVFSINAKGTLLCYKAAARVLIEQNRGGRIIGACSLAAKKGSALSGTYGASKSVVRALTQAAACEFGKFGITVNAYAPGLTDTAMLRNTDVRLGKMVGLDPGLFIESVKAQTSLNRIGQPQDIARVVSFLASENSSYITGQTLTVDGGIYFD